MGPLSKRAVELTLTNGYLTLASDNVDVLQAVMLGFAETVRYRAEPDSRYHRWERGRSV